MKTKEARRVLVECEQGLRRLVAEAAKEGDYSAIEQIAGWAKLVGSLAADGEAGTGNIPAAPEVAQPDSAARYIGPVRGSTAGRRGRPAAGEYPKFFRRGDDLVKVGWSKKGRREYSHRAPRSAVDAVAVAIRRVGAKGKMFNGDALLPLQDGSGSDVPVYQAYVALAWLKQLGILNQHGVRSGFTLVDPASIDHMISASWPTLPEWVG